MNITQMRYKLKKYGDLDFAVGKEKCYIIYKGISILSCERDSKGRFSFTKDYEKSLLDEMKYSDSIANYFKILTIIRYPIRSYRRFKKYGIGGI